MPEPLQPIALRLRGSALIEASAGTGKTWTIAALFLRLVLGHGDVVTRAGRPLVPAEILVMTFTRAATRELNERIRERLVDAAAVFRGHRPVPSEDGFLAALLGDYPEGDARDSAAWRLESAAQAMDEASIHTLDAWCQRVLREQASTIDLASDAEVLPDSHDLRLEAARDVWRQQVYPLDQPMLEAVKQVWAVPEDLARDAGLAAERPLPSLSVTPSFRAVVADNMLALAQFKAPWVAHCDQIEAWLMPLLVREDTAFKRNLVSGDKLRGWLDALRAWAMDPVAESPMLNDSAQRRLTPAGLLDAVKKNAVVPPLPACFEDFESLMTQLSALPPRATQLRALAAKLVEERLQTIKQHRQLHSHADLQLALHHALDPAEQGDAALRLRTQLLERYPAALVDEFQDTSPLQLSILDRLYRLGDDDPQTLLLLIGDPKQSIYAFRGADIHSYLRARDAMAGRQFALQVNYRSSRELVAAVNAIFQSAELREAAGAFKFGRHADGADMRLPFVPVEAAGRNDTLHLTDGPLPALTLCVDSDPCGAMVSRKRYAARCAKAIVALLSDTQARFVEPGVPDRALRPADIAVLVRSHAEAALVREAMASCGLPSVFLSDRDSVFATPEADDLLRILQAIAAPRDTRLVGAALATDVVGLSLVQLQGLADDEDAFEGMAARLATLLPIWQRQGLVAMVRAFLLRFDLPARWLQHAQGERRLTNLLHLSELVQGAAGVDPSPPAQLRWLARQVADPLSDSAGSEERVLRLESDADRVQVVTVHKSKGLEYPLVFLPFATQVRQGQRDRPWAMWLVDDDGQRRVVLNPSDVDRAQADLEQQREDLRLLYVALTRARHALWIGASLHSLGNAKEIAWHRSALGYLLSGPQPREPAAVLQAMDDMARRCVGIRLLHATPEAELAQRPARRWVDASGRQPLRTPLAYVAEFDRQWSVASYSSLAREAGGSSAAAFVPPAESLDLDDLETTSLWLAGPVMRRDEPEPALLETPARISDGAGPPWHRFPRGALAGDFLHGQLEWLAAERFALPDNPSVQQALRRRCERQAWGHRADDVQAWLSRVCSQNLPPLGASLQGLRRSIAELEFWLPSDGLKTEVLDQLCTRHCLAGQRRSALAQRQLSGLLMGFADLVFEHEGRYWVLDYKSNALGDDDHAYTQVAMERAVLEHRYDVQAALYLLPLHRLLKRRLGPTYRPAEHLGGAIFLFLRGIAASSAGCLHLRADEGLLQGLEALLPAGSAQEAGGLR